MKSTISKKLVLVAAIVTSTYAAWMSTNRPSDEPTWNGTIKGFAYSPMRPGQRPSEEDYPTEAQISADLELIAKHAEAVRTYSLEGTLGRIPSLAANYDLDVTVGVWLDENLAANRARIAELRRIVSQHSNISRVIVGNETLLAGRLTPEQLAAYLLDLREELSIPVGTAEPWHIWLEHPELEEDVDFLAVHLLPYWEGVPPDVGIDLVDSRLSELTRRFREKPIVIGEVGWPSNGRRRGAAEASYPAAETFLRRFLASASADDYEYFLMEAFDQPWKRVDEGAVGAYWGLFDGYRKAKYAMHRPLVAIPSWRALALLAAALAASSFVLLTIDARTMRWPGFLLLATTTTAVANASVWGLHDYLQQYWTLWSILAAVVLLTGIVGMVLMICIEVHEWAEADFKPHQRAPRETAAAAGRPKVSIHVPAYEEPPSMLVETLEALSRLRYPDYEVIVVDNNTRQENLWRPVEACCRRLGERFRFFHIAPLQGFKAGALNFALRHTADDAEIVAVIDSDYRVEPDWLAALVPQFEAPRVALVQAPQDYRDHESRTFKRMCEAEYRGFFRIGMVTRNERNAIIQHGTMTMIRRRVLAEVGGWAEWTITEDAELGLRILERGYDAVYTARSYGRGLTPDTFRDYRAQRYRWALGAMQILRHHGPELLGLKPSRLTRGQRFHFLTGWSAWLGDGLNLFFNYVAIAWSALMALAPLEFLPPVASFTSFVLALFVFKLLKMAWLYRRRVRANTLETLAAIWAGLSLVYIVGRAVLAGIGTKDARFVRTPKLVSRVRLLGDLRCVRHEGLLAAGLLVSAGAVSVTAPYSSIDRLAWCLLLIAFSIPHLAAVSLSIIGTLPRERETSRAAQLDDPVTDAQRS